jgi:hypothetical protein
MEPVIGVRRTAAVIQRVHALDTLTDLRNLVAVLRT